MNDFSPILSPRERRICSAIYLDGPAAMEVLSDHGVSQDSFISQHAGIFFDGARQLHGRRQLFSIIRTPDDSSHTVLYEDLVVRMKLMTTVEFVDVTKDIPSHPLLIELHELARDLRKEENRRRLARQTMELADVVAKGADTEDLNAVLRRLSEVEVVEKRRATWDQTGVVQEGIAHRRIAGQEDPALRGLPWPWPSVNDRLRPFARGELVVIAGAPSRGKSSLARQIATHAAKAQKAVAFVSLEVPAGDLFRNIAQSECGHPAEKLQSMHHCDQEEYLDALRTVRSLTISVLDDTKRLSEIISWLRRIHQKRYHDLIVIDYLGLIHETNPAKGETKAQSVGRVTAECKILAGEFDCPVLLLVQINREAIKEDNRAPRMSDIKDSGDIEAHADRIIIVHRPSVNHITKGRQEGTEPVTEIPRFFAEVYQDKGRNVGTGSVAMWFRREVARFEIISGAELLP